MSEALKFYWARITDGPEGEGLFYPRNQPYHAPSKIEVRMDASRRGESYGAIRFDPSRQGEAAGMWPPGYPDTRIVTEKFVPGGCPR